MAELNDIEQKVLESLKKGKGLGAISKENSIEPKDVQVIITKLEGLGLYKNPEKETVERKVGRDVYFLETNVDKLYDLVNRRREIGLAEASYMLGVHEERIVEWAEILESHGLIELHYPLFGKPALRVIEIKRLGKVMKEKKEVKKAIRKYKGGKRKIKVLVTVIFLLLISFVYYYMVDRELYNNAWLALLDLYSILYSFMLVILSNQLYLYMFIIVIVVLVLLLVLLRRLKRLKFWWWALRVKH